MNIMIKLIVSSDLCNDLKKSWQFTLLRSNFGNKIATKRFSLYLTITCMYILLKYLIKAHWNMSMHNSIQSQLKQFQLLKIYPD